MTLYKLGPNSLEIIDPTRCDLGWQPLHSTHIASTRGNAVDIIQARTDDIKVFSDGSGLNSHIGTAAITTGLTNTTLCYYLGCDSAHTVFEAELVGILLALHIIAHSPPRTRSALIALGDQAAIEAVRDNSAQPRQQIIQEIQRMIAKLRHTRRLLQVHIEWVPGHKSVPGNELADSAAKEASQRSASPTDMLPAYYHHCLPTSIAALKAKRKSS
ncbi:hypothetical protein FRB98_000778, partial [Tulasnella sp. 332]